jgi:hypothetical protein
LRGFAFVLDDFAMDSKKCRERRKKMHMGLRFGVWVEENVPVV